MFFSSTAKLGLIFLCVFLQCFNADALFYSHPMTEKLVTFGVTEIDFIALRNKLSFLMRIAGGYALGHLADKIGFFKTMKIICLITIAASLILFIFESSDNFQNLSIICSAHGLLAFMRWSSFILPLIYIFQRSEKSKYSKYSAIALSAVVLGMLINNMFSIITQGVDHFYVFLIYIASGITSLICYIYLDSTTKTEQKEILKNKISKEQIFLGFLLSGICGACMTYQFYFVDSYFNKIMIVETAGSNVFYSPFWITLFLVLLPLTKITKNLDFMKILKVSLGGMLISVSLFYIIPLYNRPILFIHQVIYAVSFGLFLTPALRFIYHILQGNRAYFRMNFIFGLGFSSFAMISSLLSKPKLLPGPFLGSLILTLLMTLCLLIMSYFNFSKENTAYKS